MLKIGLLGAGRIGNVHASVINSHPASQLVAVSDSFAENAEKLSKQYNVQARSTSQIIDDPEIDAVLIATSTDTHSDLIEQATAAGKAVLCEKPIDLSLQRARACRDTVAKNGQPVMLGFNRRFDPTFTALKASLHNGEIGKPELLTITSHDPAPPPVSYVKVSGGLFRDMMIHDFDMANFIMGDLPESIVTVASCQVDPEIGAAGDVDTAVVSMSYADGRIAVIKNSRRAVYGYDQRVEVLGSEGLLQAENHTENRLVKSTQSGVVSAKPTYFFVERYMPAYAAEWAAFADALSAGSAMPLTIDDGVAALAMAEAASLSAKSGQPEKLAGLL